MLALVSRKSVGSCAIDPCSSVALVPLKTSRVDEGDDRLHALRLAALSEYSRDAFPVALDPGLRHGFVRSFRDASSFPGILACLSCHERMNLLTEKGQTTTRSHRCPCRDINTYYHNTRSDITAPLRSCIFSLAPTPTAGRRLTPIPWSTSSSTWTRPSYGMV